MSNWICWYLEALNNILFSAMSEIILILLFQFLKAQTDWPSNNCCEFSVCFLCPDPLLVRCCWVSWLRGRQVQIPRNNGKLCRPEGQLQDPLRIKVPNYNEKLRSSVTVQEFFFASFEFSPSEFKRSNASTSTDYIWSRPVHCSRAPRCTDSDCHYHSLTS